VVGQSCDLSSATAVRVKDFVKGVDAYIDSINAQGGVRGRPVKIVRYDDAFKVEKALENAKRLVEQDKALILFGVGSAASTAAILPYATEKGVPILGSLSGADSLRKPNQMLFHTRASFGEEVQQVAKHLSTLGVKRVAALAADLPIGKDGSAALEQAAKAYGLEIVRVEKVAADLKNLPDASAAIAKLNPQAVLLFAPAGPGIKFTEAIRSAGYAGQLVGLSVMSSDALYKALGEKSRGMIITQVVPFPWSSKLNLTQDYQKLMVQSKIPLSIDTMEGYTMARMLIEGLQAAGANPARKSFITALEGMTDKDMGGLRITFSSKDHVATNLVNITMIGQNGKLVN
jgi:branched-chain amino acid transport system substrate-binding protein